MRYTQIKPINEMQLDEINMRPTSLRQLAAQIDARAGMEFEMIVPETEGGDNGESEPDYDQDERARSIEDIVDFFGNDMNDRSDLRRLESALGDDYMEWKYEALGDRWDRDGYDYLRDYINNHGWFDRDDAVDTARDELIDANPDLDPHSEEFQKLLSNRVDELEEQYVQDEWENGTGGNSRVYDEAQSEFNDDEGSTLDESDWLRDRGYRFMSDIENNFDVTWPYWTYGSNGGRSIDEVADSFEYAIGKPVNASHSYHGATRQAGKYVVEPDGSLEGDNPGDAGLEFVSPPMPVTEMFDDLKKVKAWAEKNGCYTNDSTGLHMNISVPSLKGSIENLDYVKLALLLGDKYVLDNFGRTGNTYTKSALDKVKSLVKSKPDDAKALLDQMKGHLGQLASKAVHTGITDKYTSINTKGGYVEFRSPGGDWLGDNFDKIESTLLRFVVALDAACSPEKYREEYLKKLYMLLDPEGGQARGGKDTVKFFADYVAGNMPKTALRSFVKQAQLERSTAKNISAAKAGEWGVWVPQTNRFARENPPDPELRRFATQADAQAWIQQRLPSSGAAARQIPADYQFPGTQDGQPSQAQFQEPNASRGTLTPTGPGPWEIYRLSDNSSVRELSHTNRQAAEQEARSALGLRGEAPELYGVRTRQSAQQAQPQQQTFTGQWDVLMGGEVVFRVAGETQGIANNAARQWILGRSPEFLRAHEGQEIEVVPRYE